MMNNSCRARHAMRERSFHWHFCLLLVLVFIAGPAVEARAEYSRDNAAIPTAADLVMMQSRSQTMVIRLLNMTPYNVVQDTAHISSMSGATPWKSRTMEGFRLRHPGWLPFS